MNHDIRVSCRCGMLHGTAVGVSGATGNRILCYCVDCRAFAKWLGTDGIIDADGASDIFQMFPAQLRFDAGRDQLACIQLREKGLVRWYASCCRTPVGNTTRSARLPFVGVVQPFMAAASRDEQLGPVRMHVNVGSAPGGKPRGIRGRPSLGAVAHALALMTKGLATGKHRPSEMFGDDGAPRAKPVVLAPEVHEAARAAAIEG